jgi:hypothetical protein
MGKDPFGKPTVKTVNGKPVVSKFSGTILETLARNGGKFVHAEHVDSLQLELGGNNVPGEIGNATGQAIPIGACFVLLALTLPYRRRITR